MKKILFILLLTCSLSLADIKWYSFRELIDNQNKIQPFDIIVLSKGNKLFQQWGHCFLVNEDMKLIEFKNYGDDFVDNPFYSFYFIENRQISVFRYKKMNKELKNKLNELLPSYYNKVYSVFTSSDTESLASYCSKFIYTIYKDAGKEVGENIELVNSSWPILPYDFTESSLLENIRLD